MKKYLVIVFLCALVSGCGTSYKFHMSRQQDENRVN